MTAPTPTPESIALQANSNMEGSRFATLCRKLRQAPRSRLVQVLIVLLLALPTLISGIYMWTMWDPEVYLKNVPVAVSNDDVGGSSDGEYENLGQQILNSMTSSGELQFHTVSSAEAVKGLKETRYAFALVIPRDFTEKVHTVTDPKPQKAQLSVLYNDFNGTLGLAVANSVIAEAQKEITATIGEGYAKEVLVGLNQLGTGLEDAADGAKQIKEGSSQLNDGTTQLADGIDQVADGIGQLKTGSTQLHDGTNQLSEGAGQLVDGSRELGVGAAQIRDGVGSIITPLLTELEPLSRSTTALMPAIDALAASRDDTIRNAAAALKSALFQLDPSAGDSITGQLSQLRDGTVELARQLNDPQAEYLSGVLELSSGAKQLDEGAKQLDNGLGELNHEMPKLQEGAGALTEGSSQLDTGVQQLSDGLSDGSALAPHVNDVPASSNMFATPVNVNIDNLQPSQKIINDDRSHKEISRGAGPLITVLGAFLFSIVMWMIIHPTQGNSVYSSPLRRAAIPLLRGVRLGMLGCLSFGVVLAAYGASIGWNPGNWVTMGAIIMLVSTTAAVTTHVFVVVFGRVFGSIISFGFFMYQIFAFGGVLPLGTTPPLFRPFRDISPMTYAQRAILRTHLSLYDHMFWISISALIVMSFGAIVVGVGIRYLIDRAHPADHASDLLFDTERAAGRAS